MTLVHQARHAMNYLENYMCNFDVEEMYGYMHVLCS